MYATDGQTDGRTDKSNAYCPLPHGRGRGIKTLYFEYAPFYCPLGNMYAAKFMFRDKMQLVLVLFLLLPVAHAVA